MPPPAIPPELINVAPRGNIFLDARPPVLLVCYISPSEVLDQEWISCVFRGWRSCNLIVDPQRVWRKEGTQQPMQFETLGKCWHVVPL